MVLKATDLLKVFPIKSVQHDCLVSGYGDITVVYRVSLPEIYTLTGNVQMHGRDRLESGEFKDLIQSWEKAISVLPDNVIIHKQDWYTEEKYQPDYSVDNYLDQAGQLHFNERPFLYHNCIVNITKTHPNRKDISSVQTTLATGKILPKTITDRKVLNEFFSSLEQFVSILESTRKIKLTRLRDEELVGDTGKPGLLERYMGLEMRDPVVPLCDLMRDPELSLGNKSIQFYGLTDVDDMPEQVYTFSKVDALSTENSAVSVCFAYPVNLMLKVNHVYNQYIFKENKHDILPKLEQRMTQMTALSSFSKNNESNARQLTQYLEYQADTGYPPVRTHFNVMVWTNDRSSMHAIRNLTTSAIAKMGIRPRESSAVEGMSLFWAAIPGNAADLPSEEKFQTFIPQACCMLNQESLNTDSLSEKGIRLCERVYGKPIIVDLSDLPMEKGIIPNRNKFVIGPSGSGKSFLTNHLVRSYLMMNSHVVIVDVGNSYLGLCQMMKGKYLTYTREKPIHFNPFYIDGRRYPEEEKIEAIKGLITTLWKKENDPISMGEQTLIGECVFSYFRLLDEDHSIEPCFNTFFEHINTGFKKILDDKKVNLRIFDFDSFRLCLEPYYMGGEYDYLLNSKTNLDLTNDRFVVFELDNIKDNKVLMPIITIIIMDTYITKLRTLEGIRKIMLIEEAWKAIMRPNMAEYILYLYKTVRKHFGEAWLVTQEVDDLTSSPIIKDTIINNAPTKILMDMREYANKFDKVQEFLSLTPKQKNLALSINRDNRPGPMYKEFAVFQGDQCAVYGLEASAAEKYAFTTEQTQKKKITDRVLLNGGDWDSAIRQQVAMDRDSL